VWLACRSQRTVEGQLGFISTGIKGRRQSISRTSNPPNPVRVVGFNTAEGWVRDMSEDVAKEIRRRCDLNGAEVPETLQSFFDRYENKDLNRR